MMGFEEIGIDFVISLVENTAPTLISSIKGDKTLKDRIDKCFRKAVDKWDVSQETRDKMEFSSIKFYSDLDKFLKHPAQGIHPKIKELLLLWIEEMKNDVVCFQFIISRKQDIEIQNTEEIRSMLNSLGSITKNTNDEVQQILSYLKTIQPNTKEGLDIESKIEGLLNGVVFSFIESLKLESARKIICEIETQFSKIRDNSLSLEALISFRKGQTLMYSDRKTAFELTHTAYKLEPTNKEYIRYEILNLTLKKDYLSAQNLVDKLPNEPQYLYLINVLNAEDRKVAYDSIPNELKNDYNFNELLLERLSDNNQIELEYIFQGNSIIPPSSFTYSTLNAWIFAAIKVRILNKDFLALSFDAPQIKDMLLNLRIIEDFHNNLSKTEIYNYFPIVKAIYYYWKYLETHDLYWLNEFQELDKRKLGEQRVYFEMVESSMLVLANRYAEAFAVVIGIKITLNTAFIQYIIMMAFICHNFVLLQWIFDKIKTENIRIDSNVSICIAHSIEKGNAQKMRSIILDMDFCNPIDKALLIQLCNYYIGDKIDVSKFKDGINSLDNNLKAYAANLLAINGDYYFAFDMLKAIVDEDVPDFKQKIYLSVLDKMVEKRPELYNILIKNRKQGNTYDENLLYKEYQLASKISDYTDAFEVITLLYNHHPDNIRIFANFLSTLGHINPKKLVDYEDKAKSLSIDDTQAAISIYSTFSGNGYLATAAEVLYRAAKSSEDLKLRTIFHNEATIGSIRTIAQEEKEISCEGDFVLCDIDGKRFLYKATEYGSEIGKAVLGVHKNDKIKTEISFEPTTLTVIGVFNKYYKLAADIMHEAKDGSNPELRPFKIDMERPVESLEKVIRKLTNNDSPEERKKKAYADYENGKLALLNLVNDSNPLASYYKFLFTPFKIHVNQSLIETHQMPQPTDNSVFILDIPSLITFAEFTEKTGMKIVGPMAITTLQQDLVETTSKVNSIFFDMDFYEAMRSDCLIKYSNSIDEDIQIHIKKLIEWIENNCKILVPDTALALDDKYNNTFMMLLQGSMSMLIKPNYYYVTDDAYIKKKMPYNKIIGTETFVKYFNNEDISKAYSRFMFECNFRGVNLDFEYILQEYKKMRHGEDNRIVAIMQNMNENPFLISQAIQCCMLLAMEETDVNSLRLTFTNMFAMAFKGFNPNYRREIYNKIDEFENYLPISYIPVRFTKMCLYDAMSIANNGDN